MAQVGGCRGTGWGCCGTGVPWYRWAWGRGGGMGCGRGVAEGGGTGCGRGVAEGGGHGLGQGGGRGGAQVVAGGWPKEGTGGGGGVAKGGGDLKGPGLMVLSICGFIFIFTIRTHIHNSHLAYHSSHCMRRSVKDSLYHHSTTYTLGPIPVNVG